jgi:MATE family multidrug resistance protein
VGIGTTALSLVFWVFNFLSIGTQTEVAQALGKNQTRRASEVTSLALLLGVVASLTMALVFLFGAGVVAQFLGAEGAVQETAVLYMHVRLLGAPAVLLTLIGMGALRGMQDMTTPLYIAGGVNLLNIVLDAPLIFGFGMIPALGVAGSALATMISQWLGAIWVLWSLHQRPGLVWHVRRDDITALVQIGGDLFVRTGLLNVFLMVATRVANQIDPEAGAAHQAIRTVWMFAALIMEGLAMTAQSLIGYFLGANQPQQALQAAFLSIWWGLGTGIGLIGLMLAGTGITAALLVPEGAIAVFYPAWVAAAMSQPLAGLAFITDGIHWGTGDYGYIRNAMLLATLAGVGALLTIDISAPEAFTGVWIATGIWLAMRAILGVVRVWPGLGDSPLREAASPVKT